MRKKGDITVIFAVIISLYCNAGMMGFLKGNAIITLMVYGATLGWFLLAFLSKEKIIQPILLSSTMIIVFFAFLQVCSIFVADKYTHSLNNMSKNILFLLVFVAMLIYYRDPEQKNGRQIILFTWIVDTVISSIYTLYRLLENPLLSRILATGNVDEYIDSTVSVAGVLGFGNIYGLVLVIIALYWCIKTTNTTMKVVLLMCGVLFCYTILQAQFFIAVVLVVTGFVVNYIFDDENSQIRGKRIFNIAMVFAFVGVTIVYLLPALIDYDVLPEMISKRIVLLYKGGSFDNLLSTSRGVVYLKSLIAIWETAGLGIVFAGGDGTGGHSEILDLIAMYGALFGAIFIGGMYKIKGLICKSIPIRPRKNYNRVWLFYLIMSVLNPSLWCPTTLCLILIIPLMYMELQNENGEDLTIENRIN